MAPRLIAAALGLAALGAGAPIEGPERTVSDESFGVEFAITDQSSVAAVPGGFLAAWKAESTQLYSAAIRATRLDPAGAPIDEGGVTLVESSIGVATLYGTALAVGQTESLVAWTEVPASPSILPTVRVALVDPAVTEGSPARGPLVIHEAEGLDYAPGAAFDPVSGRYLLAFREKGRVLARWLDPAEDEPDPAFSISNEASNLLSPDARIDVACGEEGCLVAYLDERPAGATIVATPVLGSGGAGAEVVIATYPSFSGVSGPDVEVDEGGYLITWVGNTMTTLEVQRLDLAGSPRDPAPTTIPTTGSPLRLALARAGATRHLLVWTELSGSSAAVWGAALDTQAAVQPIAAPEILNPIDFGGGGQPGVICPGAPQPCRVVHPAPSLPVPLTVAPLVTFAVPPDLGGPPGQQIDVSERPALHELPAAACSRAGACLAAWREPRIQQNIGGDVVAAVLDLEADEPLALGAPSPPYQCGYASSSSIPAVAAAPAAPGAVPRFLVGWIGGRTSQDATNAAVMVALIERDGVEVIRQLTSPSASIKVGPAVAAGGERFLVTWLSEDPVGTRLHAARVGVDGSVPEQLDAGITIPVQAGVDSPPAVTWDGEAFLIVWQATNAATSMDFFGIRVAAAGSSLQVLGDPFRITDLVPDISPDGALLASEGGGFSLVVWQQQQSLHALRVGPGGVRLGESEEILSGVPHRSPRAVFDGHTYLVTWLEGVGGAEALRGTWIAPSGDELTPGHLSLAALGPSEALPSELEDAAIGSDGAGRTLLSLVRSRFDDDGVYVDPARVRARLLGNPCVFEAPAISCVAEGCLTEGFCDPTTRTCADQSAKTDGTPCEGGLCVAGTCVADLSPGEGGGGGLGPGSDPPAGEDPGGCGCRAAGAGNHGLHAALAALALLAARARKRKR